MVFFLEESFFEDEVFLDVFFSFFPEDSAVELVVGAAVVGAVVVGAGIKGSVAGTVVATAAAGSIIGTWPMLVIGA